MKRAFKKGEDASPFKRRTTVKGPAPPKAMKTTRLPHVPRLKNSILTIWEVVPAEITRENKKTNICVPIPFSKFANDDDLDAVSQGKKLDLDPELFSCKEFCRLITQSKVLDLTKGCIALTKARRRCDKSLRDKKHQWAFRDHTEDKAEYYLERMLQQIVAQAALDPGYAFELFF